MTLNKNKNEKNSNKEPENKTTRSFKDNARLLGYKKVNKPSQSLTNIPNKEIQKVNDLNINWDDPIDIETRDSDSIRSERISRKSDKTKSPRLYTFYDYINKAKQRENNLNKKSDFDREYNIDNGPLEIYRLKPQVQNPYLTSEVIPHQAPPFYLQQQMPISSGFGAYTTTTTRRRSQPKNQQNLSNRKPASVRTLYTVGSDEDLRSKQRTISVNESSPRSKTKTVILDSDPEEEIVHVIHKSRTRKQPKEQIIYVDDDENIDKINQNTDRGVMYLERPLTPPQQKVIYSKDRSAKNVVYTSPNRQQKQKVVYVNNTRSSPVEYMYAQSPEKDFGTTVQYVYSNDHNKSPIEYVYSQQAPAIPNYVYYDNPQSDNVIYVDNYQQKPQNSRIIYR